ncbi:UNVERIFIED_CONTAM: hypothetical protein Slati_0107000 [Sesamum latifolium]|uniref:Uncharacterized protein n=1 Tax=Sesamum latifolium TaxID=2727402 RepID=A0AAW2Y904_9LAMI
MGTTVHEKPVSEPEVKGFVGPSETRSDITQAVSMTHDELPEYEQNTSNQDFSHVATEAEGVITVPTGEGVIQTDEEEVVRRVACHRRGRSMGDESTSQSASSVHGKTLSPPRRIITRSTVRSTLP